MRPRWLRNFTIFKSIVKKSLIVVKIVIFADYNFNVVNYSQCKEKD